MLALCKHSSTHSLIHPIRLFVHSSSSHHHPGEETFQGHSLVLAKTSNNDAAAVKHKHLDPRPCPALPEIERDSPCSQRSVCGSGSGFLSRTPLQTNPADPP